MLMCKVPTSHTFSKNDLLKTPFYLNVEEVFYVHYVDTYIIPHQITSYASIMVSFHILSTIILYETNIKIRYMCTSVASMLFASCI